MTACPHCKRELDEPASIDVREPVNIKGERGVVHHTKRLTPGRNIWSEEKHKWMLSVPVVYVERIGHEQNK